jgi:hypothetical protein
MRADLNPQQYTPQRNGRFYCAPFCGAGCLWRDYRAAVLSADQLCAELGEGWVPDVFENGGWYWAVSWGERQAVGRGLIDLHPRLDTKTRSPMSFSAWLQTDLQVIAEGKTAQEALLALRKAINDRIDALQQGKRALQSMLPRLSLPHL